MATLASLYLYLLYSSDILYLFIPLIAPVFGLLIFALIIQLLSIIKNLLLKIILKKYCKGYCNFSGKYNLASLEKCINEKNKWRELYYFIKNNN